MKPSIFLFPAFLVCMMTSSAQPPQFGVELGLAATSIMLPKEFNDQWDVHSRLGVRLGAAMRIPLDGEGYLALFTRLGYVQKGGELRTEDPVLLEGYPVDMSLKFKMNYMEASPQLELRGSPESSGFIVTAGVYAGLGVGARVDAVFESPLLDEPIRQTDKLEFGNSKRDDLNRVDAGATLGIGWYSENYQSGNTLRISLDAKVGMTKWARIDQTSIELPFMRDARNFSVGINMAYTFGSISH